MKGKQLLGVIVIAACILTAALAMRGTVRHSLTVQEVMASEGEPCGVYGKLVKGSEQYDMRTARLTFSLQDKTGKAMPVVYNKPKPANLTQATDIKAIGAYRDGAFHADELILKCPSKYIKDPTAPGKADPKSDPLAAFRKGA
jgi:cytochrome c-type biogenesis protein CcmE